MGRLVWAFEPLDETNGETGFVEIADEAAAEALIDAGKVQCGWNPAGGEFRHVDGKAVAAYATRQLKAAERPARPLQRAEAADGPTDPEPAESAPAPAEAAPSGKKRGRPPGSSRDRT